MGWNFSALIRQAPSSLEAAKDPRTLISLRPLRRFCLDTRFALLGMHGVTQPESRVLVATVSWSDRCAEGLRGAFLLPTLLVTRQEKHALSLPALSDRRESNVSKSRLPEASPSGNETLSIMIWSGRTAWGFRKYALPFATLESRWGGCSSSRLESLWTNL